MKNLERGGNDIAVFINDFDQEFADGLKKLSKKLGRPLHGIILIDSEVKRSKRNTPDLNHVFEQVECDFYNDVSLKSAIKAFEDRLLFVTCSAERNQPYLQRLLPHMPYILGPTESSLAWSTHKAKMRELLKSYDATLVPKVQTVTSADDEVQKVLNTLSFPLIVKPTGLASSILVSKVHDEEELQQALNKSFKVIHSIYERDRGRGDPSMIVEEFINGDMYSTDAYVDNTGTVWLLPFLRVKTGYEVGLEGFYMYQTDSYTELSKNELAAGEIAATKAVHALGLRSCVAHIELYNTMNGWKIIELGPRAGGRRQDIYAVSYGIDHAYNEFLVKIGLPPEINTKQYAYSSAIKIYAEKEGIIQSIEGLEEAKRLSSLFNIKAYAQPGDVALLSSNGGKYVVDAVLCNKDLRQLRSDVHAVRSVVNIVTDNVPLLQTT